MTPNYEKRYETALRAIADEFHGMDLEDATRQEKTIGAILVDAGFLKVHEVGEVIMQGRTTETISWFEWQKTEEF